MHKADGTMNSDTAVIRTASGRDFPLLKPDETAIDIDDIAHGLGMLCRFNGQCRRFYSVAEHSVHVSQHVPQQHALWGLLHDAAEAYLGDLPTPLKRGLPDFGRAEDKIMAAIAKKFGLPSSRPREVKHADNRMFEVEWQVLMTGPLDRTRLQSVGRTSSSSIKFWPPDEAKRQFLSRFHQILQ